MAEDKKKDEGKKDESAKLDPKYLKGLKYKTSDAKEVEENGRKVKKFVPVERALKIEDVLNWRDAGDVVIIVTADGMKHTVEKEK